MTLSPQLRALGAEIRVLAVFVDAVAAYGWYCEQVQARLDTAWLNEARSGDGWQVTSTERMMGERGWRSADDIFNEADIPEKHRRVIELALWGDPTKHKGRYFSTREIAEITGHPERTVKLWLHLDVPKLRRLSHSRLVGEGEGCLRGETSTPLLDAAHEEKAPWQSIDMRLASALSSH